MTNRTCCYFNEIIEFENFDPDNILIDEKSYGYILVYNISYKTLIDSTPFCIRFDKIDGFVRVYDVTRHYYHLELQNMTPSATGLDILYD